MTKIKNFFYNDQHFSYIYVLYEMICMFGLANVDGYETKNTNTTEHYHIFNFIFIQMTERFCSDA